MAIHTIPRLTALQAQATANQFLSDHVSDRFTAGQAAWDATEEAWRVPVILAYPRIGSLGQVGEIIVNADSEQIVSHTSFAEMQHRAEALYATHRERIEAALS